MNGPTVSIVIPTYRSERFVARAIESVRGQTFDDWELIIVDGRSDDGTRRIVESYRDSMGDRLLFIEQENAGCCFARNTGIDASRGRFVAFLDSDDEFAPGKLARQLEFFDKCPELGLVYSDYAYVDLQGSRHESVFESLQPLARTAPYMEIAPGLRLCDADLFDCLIRGYFISTIVGMVRREVLGDEIRFLNDQLYNHEWVFYLDIVLRCRAGYVNEPLSIHHFVDGSLTRRSSLINSLCARSMYHVMLRRYARESPLARRSLRMQLSQTCRQLGLHYYKCASFGAAARLFSESLLHCVDSATTLHFLQSIGKWAMAAWRSASTPDVTGERSCE